MSETKHAPGPWKIQEAFNRIETDREIIATVDGWELGNGKANARLIAAAPDMLKALQSTHTEFIGLAAYLETCSPEVIAENLPSLIASLQRKRELIEAAILKAGDWV